MRRFWVFIILLAFWLAFSGHFDLLHIGLGILCSALVAGFSHDLMFPDPPSTRTALKVWRACVYVPWLLWEIVKANLHVLYLVFRPGEIRPQLVTFRTSLTQELSKVALGNSITLTPGTITMDIENDEFHVHALSDKTAAALLTGDMERRVGHVFLEPPTAAGSSGSPEIAGR